MKKEVENDTMGFFDHLEIFRGVLFKSLISLLMLFIAYMFLMDRLFDLIILAPCNNNFILYQWICELSNWCRLTLHLDVLPEFCSKEFNVKIININLASQFLIHMSTSFWLAFLTSLPIILYFIWDFVKPALYPKEKKNAEKIFILGGVLFSIGAIIGYIIVFPLTLRFLIGYDLSNTIENQLSLDSYISSFILLVVAMGLVFELPVVAMLLSKFGLLTKGFLRKYRKHAILISLILSAVITPSGDPFTLMAVFLPIWFLYECSIFLVKA